MTFKLFQNFVIFVILLALLQILACACQDSEIQKIPQKTAYFDKKRSIFKQILVHGAKHSPLHLSLGWPSADFDVPALVRDFATLDINF